MEPRTWLGLVAAVALSTAACGSTSEAANGSPQDCTSAAAPMGSGSFDGDVVLARQADVAHIATVVEITGSLRVLPSYSGALELPHLTRIGGDLEVEGSASQPALPEQITGLRLPSLQQVGGKLWIYLAWNLIEMDLAALEAVGGEVFIMRNKSMQSVRFDRLSTVGGGVVFQAQLSLPSCATAPFPIIDADALANGDADTRCWCDSPCGHPVARCE